MLQATLFVAGRAFTAAEALAFARSRLSLAPLEAALAEGLAAAEYARESAFELAPGALQAAFEHWREQRGLLRAGQTHDWLRHFSLSLDDVSWQLELGLWRERFSTVSEAPPGDYAPPESEIRRLTAAAFLVSPLLADSAAALAVRAAVALASSDDPPGNSAGPPPEPSESAYRAFASRLVTPQSRARLVAASRLLLLRADLESAVFADPDSAAEALLCVRDDGEALSEVARQAGAAYARSLQWIEQLEPACRAFCLSAAPGELALLPAPAGGHRLLRLLAKLEPSASDPTIHERIDGELLASALQPLIARHVRWSQPAFPRPPELTAAALAPLQAGCAAEGSPA